MAANDLALLERSLLAALLHAPSALVEVHRILGGEKAFVDSRHQATYGALVHLMFNGQPTNAYTVSELCGIPAAVLQSLTTQFAALTSDELLSLAQLIRRRADDREDLQTGAEVRKLFDASTDDRHGRLLLGAQMLLTRLNESSSYRDPAIAKISERLEAEIAQYAKGDLIGPSCGLDWFDKRTAGLAPGNVWTIAGSYKARKTTIANNLVLNACLGGASVSVFALEGSQSLTNATLRAMLATRKLIAWGKANECMLSPVFVMRGRRTPAQQEALEEARQEIDKFALRIYDARDGIFDIDIVRSLIRRDKMLYELHAFTLDYVQLLGADKMGIFERMESSSRVLQRTAGEEAVTAILLSQLHESAVSAMDSIDPNNIPSSPGVKGGGDLPAASDYLFMTRYKQTTPTELGVFMWLSRFAGSGKVAFEINPYSGLILQQLPSLSN